MMTNWMSLESADARFSQEQARHLRAIARLAKEHESSVADVSRIYYEALEDLKNRNAVRAFLPILASIAARDVLLQKQRSAGREQAELFAETLI
jgi:hypothetical protein